MASSSLNPSPIFTFFVLIFSLITTKQVSCACFKSIISFGDSLADTGNLLCLSPPNSLPLSALPPYGNTFFNHPTGRFSDGRLIIDFIAEEYGLPLVAAFYGGKNVSLGGGVNFAVAGSTALPDFVFAKHGVPIPHPNVSLTAQLRWFHTDFLPAFCHQSAKPVEAHITARFIFFLCIINPIKYVLSWMKCWRLYVECKRFLATSLVLVGEIGGNDYNHPFLAGKSLELVKTFVPQVIKRISSTINELIKLGAVTLMVPGNLPIGCSASYLTMFINSNKKDYDPDTGCLKWLNRFSQYHNKLLQQQLTLIRSQNPNINIIYGDYYNAAMRFYRSPRKYGFSKGGLRACCGAGGPYNVNLTLMFGEEGSRVCEDPSLHVSWDGLHLTEAAYRFIAAALVRGSYTFPNLYSLCTAGFSDN